MHRNFLLYSWIYLCIVVDAVRLSAYLGRYCYTIVNVKSVRSDGHDRAPKSNSGAACSKGSSSGAGQGCPGRHAEDQIAPYRHQW